MEKNKKTVIEVFINSFYNQEEHALAEQLTIGNARNKASGVLIKEKKRLEASKHKKDFINSHDKEKAQELKKENKVINSEIAELDEYRKDNKGLSGKEKKEIEKQLSEKIKCADTTKFRTLKLTNNEVYVKEYNNVLECAGVLTEHNRYEVKTIEDCTKNNTWTDSSLIRAIELNGNTFNNDDCIVVNRGKKFNDPILRQITRQGFKYNDKDYIFFSSSASELKNGQATFIKEEVYDRIEMTLTCGLTLEDINRLGGMNTNKFMSYKSLSKSSSSKWEEFDIDAAIVVDDIEFNVEGKEVDYIHHQTLAEQQKNGIIKKNTLYLARRSKFKKGNISPGKKVKKLRRETSIRKPFWSTRNVMHVENRAKISQYKKSKGRRVVKVTVCRWDTIERKIMDVPYNFTDGMGITCDKEVSNRIIRFPWGKGLLTFDNYRTYIKEHECKGHIEDIWGKKYSMTSLKNAKIKYILFKSTFKMDKYYPNELDEQGEVIKYGWDIYKENFKKYQCEASIVEIEPKKLKSTRRLNYQMLQQLNAVATDEEIKQLSKKSIDSIDKIGSCLDTTLRMFGASDGNEKMTYFQNSILRYKPLMKSHMMKDKINSLKASRVNGFKGGRLEFDAVMTFVVPDIMVINQWLFDGIRDVKAMKNILDENEVICDSFKVGDRVDVLRSPSLGFEHNVMQIVGPKNDEGNEKAIKQYKSNYYKTRAVYTSAKSLLSKVIFFDNDGDKLYLVQDDTLCDIVDRFKKEYNIVPLYFDMEKASAIQLNADTFTDGMLSAFGVSIGEWSNPISKLWDELNNGEGVVETTKRQELEGMTLKQLKKCANYQGIKIDKKYKKEDIVGLLAEDTKDDEEKTPIDRADQIKKTLKLINLFVMYNNFAIDSAKTNFIPVMTPDVAAKQKEYKLPHAKLPHFFKFAKDKKNVKNRGYGFVDKVSDLNTIQKNTFKWLQTKGFNKTECSIEQIEEVLLNGQKCILNQEDIEKVMELINKRKCPKDKEVFLKQLELDQEQVMNVLVRNCLDKDKVWDMFGEEIYNNIVQNTSDKMKICPECGAYFEYSTDDKRCEKCRKN